MDAIRLLESARADLGDEQFSAVVKLITRVLKNIITNSSDKTKRSINSGAFRSKTYENSKVFSAMQSLGFVERDGRLVLPDQVSETTLVNFLSRLEASQKPLSTTAEAQPPAGLSSVPRPPFRGESASSARASSSVLSAEASGTPSSSTAGSKSYNSEDPLTVCACLAYHLHQPYVLSLGVTSKQGNLLPHVKESLSIVEKAGNRMGIFHATGKAGHAWKALKEEVEKTIESGIPLSSDQWQLLVTSVTEIGTVLQAKCPKGATVLSFMSVCFALLTHVRGRQSLPSGLTEQYMQLSMELPNDRLSETYKKKLEEATDGVLQAATGATVNVPVLSSSLQFLLLDFISHFQCFEEPSLDSGLPRCSTFSGSASLQSSSTQASEGGPPSSSSRSMFGASETESHSGISGISQPSTSASDSGLGSRSAGGPGGMDSMGLGGPGLGGLGGPGLGGLGGPGFGGLGGPGFGGLGGPGFGGLGGPGFGGLGGPGFGGLGGPGLGGLGGPGLGGGLGGLSSSLDRPGSLSGKGRPKTTTGTTAGKNDKDDKDDEEDLDSMDAEKLYKLLEEFLNSIEEDIPTQFKVLREWLPFANREILVDACKLLSVDAGSSNSDDEIVRKLQEDIEKKEKEGVFVREQESRRFSKEAMGADEKDEDTTTLGDD